MKRQAIDWHVPRADLAEHWLQACLTLGTSALAFHAPGGSGKTDFLVKDLMPAARRHGMLPIYINFADDSNDPAESLRYGLTKSLSVNPQLPGSILDAGVEVNLDLDLIVAKLGLKKNLGKPAAQCSESNPFFEMRELADAIRRHAQCPLLLVMDSADVLSQRASSHPNDPFLSSFRSMLDERREDIHSVLAFSSERRLTELCSRPKSALKGFAQTVAMPSMGMEVVDHFWNNVRQIRAPRATLGSRDSSDIPDRASMVRAWKMLDCNVSAYRRAVTQMILDNDSAIERHASVIRDEFNAQWDPTRLERRWQLLASVDRAVLASLAFGSTAVCAPLALPDREEQLAVFETAHDEGRWVRVFSKAQRGAMACIHGDVPSTSQVQSALDRLMGSQPPWVIHRGSRGDYDIAEEPVRQWLTDRLQEWAPHFTKMNQEVLACAKFTNVCLDSGVHAAEDDENGLVDAMDIDRDVPSDAGVGNRLHAGRQSHRGTVHGPLDVPAASHMSRWGFRFDEQFRRIQKSREAACGIGASPPGSGSKPMEPGDQCPGQDATRVNRSRAKGPVPMGG